MSGLVVFNQWTPVDCCSGGAPTMMTPVAEAVSVLSLNTLAPLANTPVPNPIALFVNGQAFFNVGAAPPFSVSGNTITWLSSLYSISPGDDVVALYYYFVL